MIGMSGFMIELQESGIDISDFDDWTEEEERWISFSGPVDIDQRVFKIASSVGLIFAGGVSAGSVNFNGGPIPGVNSFSRRQYRFVRDLPELS